MLQFRGSLVTSDAGLLAYRELDDALGLTEMAGDVLADARSGKSGRHALAGLFRQAVFGCLAGYEERLRHDRLCAGLSAAKRRRGARLRRIGWGASRRYRSGARERLERPLRLPCPAAVMCARVGRSRYRFALRRNAEPHPMMDRPFALALLSSMPGVAAAGSARDGCTGRGQHRRASLRRRSRANSRK